MSLCKLHMCVICKWGCIFVWRNARCGCYLYICVIFCVFKHCVVCICANIFVCVGVCGSVIVYLCVLVWGSVRV